ncbi:5-oxoprolinase subunit PxpA [Echinicola sediminis]
MRVDINSDLGEGTGADASIMPFISSCNIACGGHAGNAESMQETIKLALQHKVKTGAHPSYPDPINFGRKTMDIPLESLEKELLSQIKELQKWILEQGGTMHHIKPHGALYNEAAVNPKIAKLIVKILKNHFPDTLLYVPDQSIIAQVAEKEGIPLWFEIFADRNYNDDLTLVSRKEANAVLHDKDEVLAHLESMILKGQVKTISKNLLPIKVDTICVHGDNPSALKLSASIHRFIQSIS